MKTYIADSYAWLAYFDGFRTFKEPMEGNYVETPSIVVAEVVRVLVRRNIPAHKIQDFVEFMHNRSLILELGLEQAVLAGRIASADKLPFVDAIIYSYSTKDKPILTGDEHFKGKPNVEFVKEA